MKDIRQQQKAERQRAAEPKRCVICKRWHTKKGSTCGRKCAERLEGQNLEPRNG
jgi:hypothetical protein